MPKRTRPYRDGLLDYLKDPVASKHYLNASIADSYGMFLSALRDVAEAQQMAQVASNAGIARESLYRMLSGTGNPTFNNLIGILKALGLALKVDTLSSEYHEDDSTEEGQEELKLGKPIGGEPHAQNIQSYGKLAEVARSPRRRIGVLVPQRTILKRPRSAKREQIDSFKRESYAAA